MTDATNDDKHDNKPDSKTSPFDLWCSICLESFTGDRSRAKLQCGHEFHLDCIGSAFNMKGAMQCPNCRKVEIGRWLYATGSTRSFPDISLDNWTPHEDQSGLNYPAIPFNIHWCPLSGLAQVHSALVAVEPSPTAYHNFERDHTMFAEHGAASAVAHSYVAYFGPIPPASSNTNGTVEDPNFSYHWNGVPGQSEIFNPHAFAATELHYQSGGYHSHLLSANSGLVNGSDRASISPLTLRSTRGDFGAVTRSGSFINPFLYGHGSWSHESSLPSHTIHHPHQPSNPLGLPSGFISGMPRFHGRRALPPHVPANSLSDSNGGFFIFPSQGSAGQNSHGMENSLPVISSDWNSSWSSFPHGGGPYLSRTGSFWHRH